MNVIYSGTHTNTHKHTHKHTHTPSTDVADKSNFKKPGAH